MFIKKETNIHSQNITFVQRTFSLKMEAGVGHIYKKRKTRFVYIFLYIYMYILYIHSIKLIPCGTTISSGYFGGKKNEEGNT